MELSEKDKFGLDKRNGGHVNYQSSGLTSEWQFNHQSIDPSSSCPSISMVDSLCSNLYNNPSNPQNPIGKVLPMGWNQGILPSSFSHFPTDSGFIERAAKFSCFSGGNFSSMLNNPFTTNESLGPYPIASKALSDSQSPMNDQRDVKESNNEAGEAEFSGDGQENSSSKENGPKKRKRINQDMELGQIQGASPMSIETTNENVLDTKQKGGQDSSTMANAKPSGTNAKNSTDGAKEDYIHVRARRGQATNSHSLAERVRREKISERMKFLQDLVPGCSKVTGKAVMLDEIINYVQSLQRQVEFLSMKLAAVNPTLDFNIEGLLSKDLLQLRGGSSSAIGFSPQRIHPQLHPSQQGLIQAGISSMAINAQMPQVFPIFSQFSSCRDSKKDKVPNTWEDELSNVLQMNFGNAQELNAKPRDGFPL